MVTTTIDDAWLKNNEKAGSPFVPPEGHAPGSDGYNKAYAYWVAQQGYSDKYIWPALLCGAFVAGIGAIMGMQSTSSLARNFAAGFLGMGLSRAGTNVYRYGTLSSPSLGYSGGYVPS